MALFRLRGLRILASCLVLAALLGLTGCGGTGTISGKVTINGKNLKGGRVTFVATGKPSRSGEIKEDGTYSVADVPTGTVKVCVDTSSLKPPKTTANMKYSAPPGQKGPEGFGESDATSSAKRYMPIPDEYGDPDKTKLTLEVKGGKQEHNIDLVN